MLMGPSEVEVSEVGVPPVLYGMGQLPDVLSKTKDDSDTTDDEEPCLILRYGEVEDDGSHSEEHEESGQCVVYFSHDGIIRSGTVRCRPQP